MAKYAPKEKFLTTNSGHKITIREAKFISEYIATGNYSEAAKRAGYRGTRISGNNLLSRDYIKEEIEYQMEQLKSEKIADASEILEYLSSVMRGDVQDQFGLEAPLSERTKAAQELAKRQIDMQQKLAVPEVPQIKVTLDWGDGK
jgi:phage terminase small subunit